MVVWSQPLAQMVRTVAACAWPAIKKKRLRNRYKFFRVIYVIHHKAITMSVYGIGLSFRYVEGPHYSSYRGASWVGNSFVIVRKGLQHGFVNKYGFSQGVPSLTTRVYDYQYVGQIAVAFRYRVAFY